MPKQDGALKPSPARHCRWAVKFRPSSALPGSCMNFANYFNRSKSNAFVNKWGNEINLVVRQIHRPVCTLDGPTWKNSNKAAKSLKPQWTSRSGLTRKSSHIHCHSLVRLGIKKAYQNAANSYLFIFGNSIVLYKHKNIQGKVCKPKTKMFVLLSTEKYLISFISY